LPSFTKVHAAPWQGAKNEVAEVAASSALRGLAQPLFCTPWFAHGQFAFFGVDYAKCYEKYTRAPRISWGAILGGWRGGERAQLTRGHVVSAFRSMLQPVVTAPSQEQVAGSVKPFLQKSNNQLPAQLVWNQAPSFTYTKLTSKSALGVPNQEAKFASMSVESVLMENWASLMAMFPTQPGCTANVAVAPDAIVPGASGEPLLVGVPTVSSCAVETAAVWELTMVKVRSPATDGYAAAEETAGGLGAALDEGTAMGVVLLECANTSSSGIATGVGTGLLVEGGDGEALEVELLLGSWAKIASRLEDDVVAMLVVDVELELDVEDDVGDTGDPSGYTNCVTQVVTTSTTVASARGCRCACSWRCWWAALRC
jgi:hypothetical protein